MNRLLTFRAALIVGVGMTALASGRAEAADKPDEKGNNSTPPRKTLIEPGILLWQAVVVPGGERLVCVVGKERMLRLVDSATGESHVWEEGADGAGSVAVSPDGRLVAVGRKSGHVDVHELESGKRLRSFQVVKEEHPEPFVLGPGSDGESAIAISPDGKILAATDWTMSVSLWRFPEGMLIGRVRNPGKESHEGLGGMSFGPDSKTLFNLCVGVEAKGFASIWDLQTSKMKHSFVPPRTTGVMAVSPDGKHVATGDSFNRWISLWNVESLPKNVAAPPLTGGNCKALAFSPDGKRLASLSTAMGHEQPTIAVWDVPAGRKTREWPALEGLFVGGFLVFSPDGKTLFSGGQNKGLTKWDLSGSP